MTTLQPIIDLNADLGEGLESDDELLAVVSSASIACGGHAGDPQTMRRVLAACRDRGVRAGAHPGYVDKRNFGRLRLVMPMDQLLAQIRSQLILIRHVAAETGTGLAYVKLHGALANETAEQLAFAVAIFATVQAMDPKLAVLALDNSEQVRAANAVGVPAIREAYADRAYTAEGLLLARGLPGAVLEDPAEVVERCLRLAKHGEIEAIDGSVFRSAARSVCLHGDTPGAVAMAHAVRQALEAAGVTIAPVSA